ncbi:hypothetical protein C8J57DRAFT_1232314 [Mycena rebaudengoi]|nr:hypothetical protein C8J57DRAFT_1232314 [Mycena rebaudengoi]
MDGVGHAGGARLGSRSYWYWWGFGFGFSLVGMVTVEVTESSSTVFVEAAWRAAPRAAVALAGRGARAGGAGRSRGEKSKEGTLRSVGTAATGVVIAKIGTADRNSRPLSATGPVSRLFTGWWEAVLFRFFPDCATALLRPDGNSLEGSQEYGVVWMVLRSPSESKNRKRPDAAGFSGRVFQVFKREGLILAAAAVRQRALFKPRDIGTHFSTSFSATEPSTTHSPTIHTHTMGTSFKSGPATRTTTTKYSIQSPLQTYSLVLRSTADNQLSFAVQVYVVIEQPPELSLV